MINLNNLLSFDFSMLLNKSFKQRKVLAPNTIDYSEIALQIASTENLEEFFPIFIAEVAAKKDFLNEIENYEEIYILTCLEGNSHKLHCSAISTQSKRRLSFLESIQPTRLDQKQNYTIEEFNGRHYLFLPMIKNEVYLGSLVICLRGKVMDLIDMTGITRPLRNAIEKGLWLQYKTYSNVQKAIEKERQLQAADLHDTIAQVLSYLKLKVSSLSSNNKSNNHEQVNLLIQDIETQVSYAHRLTRELISSSRLTANSNGLSQSIQSAMEEFEQLSGIVFELDNRCQSTLKNVSHSGEVLFIIREALCNIVRHSHATHARIIISKCTVSNHLQIIIEDNGVGIDTTNQRLDSFGLQIMQERARRLQSQLEISKRAEGGTRVELNLRAAA